MVAGLSIVVYTQTAANLLGTIDAGLSSRAGVLAGNVRDDGPAQVSVEPTLIEGTKVFAQIDDASGQVLRSTARIARSRLLSPGEARSLRRATSYDRTVRGIGTCRVFAVPVVTRDGRLVIVAVGASLQDRHTNSSSSPPRSPLPGRPRWSSSPSAPGWHSPARCGRSSGCEGRPRKSRPPIRGAGCRWPPGKDQADRGPARAVPGPRGSAPCPAGRGGTAGTAR